MPAIGVFSLTTACYTSLVVGLATARESGLLKRVRGTPLPVAIHLGSWCAGAMLTGLGSVLALFLVAVPAFGVDVYLETLPAHHEPRWTATGSGVPRTRLSSPVSRAVARPTIRLV